MSNKKLILSFVCLLLTLLVACNNNNQALENGTISSLSTDSASDNYPHTQPVKIQNAKYEFRVIEGNINNENQKQYLTRFQEQKQGNLQQQYQQPAQQQEKQTEQQTQQQQNQQTGQQAQQQQQNQQTEQPTQQPNQQNNLRDQGMSDFVASVIELTNAERTKQGLSPFQAYPDLNKVADAKAQDMADKGYFSHTSPTYGSPFDMMRDFGISYKSAGENIAAGQRSPEEVVDAWMNSEGHRANILSQKFTHIGVGFEQNGNQWVQMFIKK